MLKPATIPDSIKQLEKEIESYTSEQLTGFSRRKVPEQKVIRDAILGSNVFQPYEIHLMDTPLMQRLRDIHQTALAYFTYPSAHHTRFDHSLGVRIIVGKLLSALTTKIIGENKNLPPAEQWPIPSPEQIANTQVAALLHDIGHCVFSHISEREYSRHPAIGQMKKLYGVTASGHELLSFLLVRSRPVSALIEEVGKLYGVGLDAEKISQLILGSGEPQERFLANMVYGVFDADKLDYIPRDCYFTGLRMSVDLERIAYTMCLLKEGEQISLGIDISGAYSVEQILFNKMLLYTSIYHHHKVLSSECMLLSLFDLLKEHQGQPNVPNLMSPVDFLRLTEGAILEPNGKPKPIADHIRKIKRRELLQRAAVLSFRTVARSKEYFDFLSYVRENPEHVKQIRQSLLNRLKTKRGVFSNWRIEDVWLNVPTPPKFDEVSNSRVRIGRADGKYDAITLNDLFPSSNWSDVYAQHKLQSWVFCPSCEPAEKAEVAKEVKALLTEFGIEIRENFVTEAKHR